VQGLIVPEREETHWRTRSGASLGIVSVVRECRLPLKVLLASTVQKKSARGFMTN
jgi:hypothetical protein